MHPVPGADYSHTYPEFFAPATKNYTITVVAYSGDNCLSTSSQTLVLKATPEIVFDSLASVCANLPSFPMNQAGVVNAIQGTGVYSGPGVSSSGNFDPLAAGAGNHTIRYTYTAANGCINYKEQNITVFPVPVVDAGPDQFILEGGSGVLPGSASGNGLSYAWSPATWLNNTSLLQPTVTPTNDITYTLTVTSADGCIISDEVFVKVLKTPTIPNTFSPNGDGVHDKWEIKYLNSYPGCTVEVYNRYGQLVFRSTGYNQAWDGTFKGKPLPAGTYYYLINPKNGRKQMSGFVDIIR
jgi:gliding motility-associated-like protein